MRAKRLEVLGDSGDNALPSAATPEGSNIDTPARANTPETPVGHRRELRPLHRSTQSLPQHLPNRLDDVQHWDSVRGLDDEHWGGGVTSDTESDEPRKGETPWDAFTRQSASCWRPDAEAEDEAGWSDSNKTVESQDAPRSKSVRIFPGVSDEPTPSSSTTSFHVLTPGTAARLPAGSSQSAHGQLSQRPHHKSNEVCRKWERGHCDKGSNCQYLHMTSIRDDNLVCTLHFISDIFLKPLAAPSTSPA